MKTATMNLTKSELRMLNVAVWDCQFDNIAAANKLMEKIVKAQKEIKKGESK